VVLKTDDRLLDDVAFPDVWLDDKIPELLRTKNKEAELVSMKLLGRNKTWGFCSNSETSIATRLKR
jgi:hypothetical protein